MADMMETLKSLLGDNAEDKISSLVKTLNIDTSASPPTPSEPDMPSADLMLQAQSLLSKLSSGDDTRSNLLMSLKPYMRENRKKTIDNAVKLLNMAQLSDLFKGGI